MRPFRTLVVVAWTALLLQLAAGELEASSAPRLVAGSDTLAALRIDPDLEGGVHVDGLLSEPFWQRAAVIDGFMQREPEEGVPATETTEVRVVYDDDALYVGIVARDSEPQRIVARLLQRDRILSRGGFGGFSFAGDDAVALLLDPFHDHRNGVVLATNPNGAQYDALVSDEGSEINTDWRGVWEVRAQRIPEGWSAEFAIPWRSLRYPGGGQDGVWGFNVYRMIQRKKEEVLWRGWEREGGGFQRVSQAGHLAGLHDLPRPGLNVEVKPFALAETTRARSEVGDYSNDNQFDVGLDLKSELRPGLVMDLTANTDFAQVEVDDQQVNLTRFNLFFPEKRDFFLENAGIFQFGQPGFMETPPYLMFFSRRIGIGPEGEVPILGGGRVTGRVGGQTVGAMVVATDDASGRDKELFSLARIKRDVGESDYLGAMLTDRRGDGPGNTVVGLDGQFHLHPTLTLAGFMARSFTAGEGGDGLAYQASLDLTTDLWGGYAQFFRVDPEAVARSGFITRTDIQRSQLFLRRRLRPAGLGLRLVDFRLSGSYQSHTDGRFQDYSLGATAAPTWNAGDNVSLAYTAGETRVDDPFPLADSLPVPAGRYATDNWSASASSSSARPWVVSGNLRGADFYGGDLLAWGGSLSVTPTPSLSLTGSFSRNDVSIPSGSFTADIVALRGIWALSTRVTTNALVQYNRLTEDLITNVRFNFIHRPGSDLYVVFTEARGVEGDLWTLGDRGLVVKLTWLQRF